MQAVTFAGIEVDRCTGCGGLWFDGGEERRLKVIKGSESIDTGDPTIGRKNNDMRGVQCPRCTTPLVRMVDREQPHIWFESCSACGGVYFDAGEFRDYKEHTIADFFRDLFAKERT